MTESTLKFARYQFNFQVETPLHLNFYSGSMLRGVFGHALRQLSCMTKQKECKTCPLYQTCPYPLIFEHPPQACDFQDFSQIPNPYIIEPPPLGHKVYQAGEVLIGNAISQLPLIIYAWQRAFAFGLGKERGKAHLLSVFYQSAPTQSQLIYDTAVDHAVRAYSITEPLKLKPTNHVSLTFLTPLQIRKQNKILTHDMTIRDFLNALIRRYFFLQKFYGESYQAPDFKALLAQAEKVMAEFDLRWCPWQRYSHRQQAVMPCHGVVGQVLLQGDLSNFLPMLQHGQWLHVGKMTTFGMGQYVLAFD